MIQQPAPVPPVIVVPVEVAPVPPTKKEAVAVAAKEGGSSLGFTGSGVTGAGGLVLAVNRIFDAQMTLEEGLFWMGVASSAIVPAMRIAWSIARQWLQHRNIQVE